MSKAALPEGLHLYKDRFERHLNAALSSELRGVNGEAVSTLHQAMAYSALNGGKRIRAMLVYLAANCCGMTIEHRSPESQGFKGFSGSVNNACKNNTCENVDAAALAVEMIHCYSLIHDDLPALDDDAMRRGKATCHIAFGEANAILAGDALQALAFDTLARAGEIEAAQRIELIGILAEAAGRSGMVAGQAIDLASTDRCIELEQLVDMHQLKTGALIEAAVKMGAVCAAASQLQIDALQVYAQAIGLAFQIRDDILDVEGDPELTGKSQGADIAANKPTFPSLLGLDQAKIRAQQLCEQALAALQPFGDRAKPLQQLARYLVAREI